MRALIMYFVCFLRRHRPHLSVLRIEMVVLLLFENDDDTGTGMVGIESIHREPASFAHMPTEGRPMYQQASK